MPNNFMHPPTGGASIYTCLVTRVRPEKMSIDVYIPETSAKIQGVNLLSGSLGTTYGLITIPAEGTLGLVAKYHNSKLPVFLGAIPGNGFNSGEQTFESLHQGEYQITGIGGSFSKMDRVGNHIHGSKKFAHQWMTADGADVKVAKVFSEFSNLYRNHLRIAENNDIISLTRSFDYRQCSQLKRYRKDDLLSGGSLDWDKASQILRGASDAISSLVGDDGIFAKTKRIVSSLAVERACSESDIDAYEEYLKTLQLKSDGYRVRGEIFGDSALKLEVVDKDGTLVSGIEIDGEFGGKLTGRWME